MPGKIGLISAVPFEAGRILKEFPFRGEKAFPLLGGVQGWVVFGEIGGKKTVYSCSGIGIANAAHAVTVMAEVLKPDLIILFGTGGAYPGSGLALGEVALADTEIYGDCGIVEPGGFLDMSAIGFPLLKNGRKEFFNEFPLNGGILKKAVKVLGARTGRFVTVCAGTRSKKRALELEKRWGGIVENMEGAAAAQIALLYDIPLIEIRGISNITGDPPARWKKELAAEECQKGVEKLIESL
jgi:futalosine hydrolase